MDAKINDFWYLFEKGEKPRNYLKTNRILGFRHAKRYQKSIQTPCKIDARKSHAKSMKNDAKMHPKWEPKTIQNSKNTGKTASENWCRNLMPKKNQNVSPTALFHRFWIEFLAVPGGRGAVDTWKYRIDSNNLTRSLPRWGAADQNGSQNRC